MLICCKIYNFVDNGVTHYKTEKQVLVIMYIMIEILYFTEIPVEFVAELTEQHVEEHKASYFTCEVNKPDVTVT